MLNNSLLRSSLIHVTVNYYINYQTIRNFIFKFCSNKMGMSSFYLKFSKKIELTKWKVNNEILSKVILNRSNLWSNVINPLINYRSIS